MLSFREASTIVMLSALVSKEIWYVFWILSRRISTTDSLLAFR